MRRSRLRTSTPGPRHMQRISKQTTFHRGCAHLHFGSQLNPFASIATCASLHLALCHCERLAYLNLACARRSSALIPPAIDDVLALVFARHPTFWAAFLTSRLSLLVRFSTLSRSTRPILSHGSRFTSSHPTRPRPKRSTKRHQLDTSCGHFCS